MLSRTSVRITDSELSSWDSVTHLICGILAATFVFALQSLLSVSPSDCLVKWPSHLLLMDGPYCGVSQEFKDKRCIEEGDKKQRSEQESEVLMVNQNHRTIRNNFIQRDWSSKKKTVKEMAAEHGLGESTVYAILYGILGKDEEYEFFNWKRERRRDQRAFVQILHDVGYTEKEMLNAIEKRYSKAVARSTLYAMLRSTDANYDYEMMVSVGDGLLDEYGEAVDAGVYFVRFFACDRKERAFTLRLVTSTLPKLFIVGIEDVQNKIKVYGE